MKFIKDPKKVLLHYSTLALGIATTLQSSLVMLPQSVIDMQLPVIGYSIGQGLVALTVVIVVLGLIGKFIQQGTPAP